MMPERRKSLLCAFCVLSNPLIRADKSGQIGTKGNEMKVYRCRKKLLFMGLR